MLREEEQREGRGRKSFTFSIRREIAFLEGGRVPKRMTSYKSPYYRAVRKVIQSHGSAASR